MPGTEVVPQAEDDTRATDFSVALHFLHGGERDCASDRDAAGRGRARVSAERNAGWCRLFALCAGRTSDEGLLAGWHEDGRKAVQPSGKEDGERFPNRFPGAEGVPQPWT